MIVHTVGQLRKALAEYNDRALLPIDIEIVGRVGNVYLPLDLVHAKHLLVTKDRDNRPALTMVVDAGCFGPQV